MVTQRKETERLRKEAEKVISFINKGDLNIVIETKTITT